MHFLYSLQGREAEACQTLMWLRKCPQDAIQKEIQDIRQVLAESGQNSISLVEFFRERRFFIPVILSLCMVTVCQLSGVGPVAAYTEPIFKESGYKSEYSLKSCFNKIMFHKLLCGDTCRYRPTYM